MRNDAKQQSHRIKYSHKKKEPTVSPDYRGYFSQDYKIFFLYVVEE